MVESIDVYLDQLERALDLPAAERTGVREEIASHLLEEQSSLIADGLDPDAATAEAVRRQGDAVALGHALTRARHPRRALLAASGAGTWAAFGAAIGGWIIGVAILVSVLIAAGVVTAIGVRIGAIGTWAVMDQGRYLAVAATTLWFAAWAAGRALVSAFARGAHRRAERVRGWVTIAGTSVVAWLVLVWLRGPQDLASVVALTLVPIIFGIAAWTGSDLPIVRSRRTRYATIGLVATLVIGIPLLAFATTGPIITTLSAVGSGPYTSMADLRRAQNLDLTGRLLNDVPDVGGSAWSSSSGVVSVAVDNGDALTSRWHDLRFEAWRATLASNTLDRGWTAPFATAPASLTADQQLTGALRVDGARNVSEFIVVLTGIAADGQRDHITSLGGTNTWFTGSVLSWLTAP